MKVSALIPAAGQGTRMNTEINKQFLTLRDKPILMRTIRQFQQADQIDEIVVVAHQDEVDYCRTEIVTNYQLDKVKKVVAGGTSRQESVYNGLSAVDETADFVLIHDGARPLLTISLINNIIEEVRKYKAVITGVPVKDTVKVINQEQVVVNTPDRSQLVAVQTPQAFTRDLVMKAYQQAEEEGIAGTDSSSLVERLGKSVTVVEGSYENLKITTPEDLEFADKILEMRQCE